MFNEEQLKLILEDEELKALYKEVLAKELRVKALDLQTKYNSLAAGEVEEKKKKIQVFDAF